MTNIEEVFPFASSNCRHCPELGAAACVVTGLTTTEDRLISSAVATDPIESLREFMPVVIQNEDGVEATPPAEALGMIQDMLREGLGTELTRVQADIVERTDVAHTIAEACTGGPLLFTEVRGHEKHTVVSCGSSTGTHPQHIRLTNHFVSPATGPEVALGRGRRVTRILSYLARTHLLEKPLRKLTRRNTT